ncbi:MAG: hypothetical protein NWE88_08085 [Candidatus Bathyarchaeota archaeon]|nr:hypothetical protein [Candidatus Bathyarchaeota archaeon]
MGKNVTIAIPDELEKWMESFPEVNWSQVARTCIYKYVAQRLNPDVSELLENIENEKGVQYKDGRRFGETLLGKMGYVEFNILLKKYRDGMLDEHIKSMEGPFEPYEKVYSSDEVMERLLKDKGLISEESSEYIKGIRERLLELDNALAGRVKNK